MSKYEKMIATTSGVITAVTVISIGIIYTHRKLIMEIYKL